MAERGVDLHWLTPLRTHISPDTPVPTHYPAPPLDVSSWADVVTHSTQYGWSSPLHFTNVRDNSTACLDKTKCTFDYDRDCVDRDGNNPGFCNAGAIANYTTRLSQGLAAGLANNDTRDALKFLIHFVGDIHQRTFPTSCINCVLSLYSCASSPGTDTDTHALYTHHSFVAHARGPTHRCSGQWAARTPTIVNVPHVFSPLFAPNVALPPPPTLSPPPPPHTYLNTSSHTHNGAQRCTVGSSPTVGGS